jgi:hypothetical protein
LNKRWISADLSFDEPNASLRFRLNIEQPVPALPPFPLFDIIIDIGKENEESRVTVWADFEVKMESLALSPKWNSIDSLSKATITLVFT